LLFLFIDVVTDLTAGIIVQNDELETAGVTAFPSQFGVSIHRFELLDLEVDLEDIRGRVGIADLEADTALADVIALGSDPMGLNFKDITGFGLHNRVDGHVAVELNAGKLTFVVTGVVSHDALVVNMESDRNIIPLFTDYKTIKWFCVRLQPIMD
jgi:hypothetical protein